MTQTEVDPLVRRTVMTASRPEIEAMILNLDREGRWLGAGLGTYVGEGQWKVPLVFRKVGTAGKELVLASRPHLLPDLAHLVFGDAPTATPLWRRRWPYVTGGVVTVLGGVVWVGGVVGGVVAMYGTTILGAAVVLGGLLAVALTDHSGEHRCILPGCGH